jgi:hypothetical protein
LNALDQADILKEDKYIENLKDATCAEIELEERLPTGVSLNQVFTITVIMINSLSRGVIYHDHPSIVQANKIRY